LLQYFFSSSGGPNHNFNFLKELKDFYLQDSIDFEPHYVTWYCAPCQQKNFEIANDDCLSGGRYCAPDPGISIEYFSELY